MKLPKAVEQGLFSEASWALDIAKKDSYMMLYSYPGRHAKLVKYLEPKVNVQGVCQIKFDGLILQFSNTQILLFAEVDDQILVDFIKENKIRINIGMCAEAAEAYKKKYNQMMAAVRTFLDQDGSCKDFVEDRRDEARKMVEESIPKRDTAGEARTFGNPGTYPPKGNYYGPNDSYDPDEAPII